MFVVNVFPEVKSFTLSNERLIDEMTIEVLMEELRARHEGAGRAAAALRELRAQVDATAKQLENPNAAREYIDFFADFFDRAATELEQIAGQLADGIERPHADALRQLANNSAAEQRRAGMFRDKWVNRPLPYETVRPLLTAISNTTRDEIAALRTLADAVAAIEPSIGQPDAGDAKAVGRRQLFTRLFRSSTET
jgi:hypothetical protein